MMVTLLAHDGYAARTWRSCH